MSIRQDQCNKVCRIIDDYLANRPRERDELIIAVRTVFKEADRKTEPQTERAETMSCQECKWWFTDSLKHGGYCQSLLYNHECRYEPEVDCSWK